MEHPSSWSISQAEIKMNEGRDPSNSSIIPRIFAQFPTCNVSNVGFESVLLHMWKPGGISYGGFQYIRCRLCPPNEGITFNYDLQEVHLFVHLLSYHLGWWESLQWAPLDCPLTYNDWKSTVEMVSLRSVLSLREQWDDDSDLSSEPSCSTMLMEPNEECQSIRCASEEY